MTALDPYPETLTDEDLGFAPKVSVDPSVTLVAAINRLAQAVEQNTLAILDRPQPVQNGPQRLAALPPVQAAAPAQTGPGCPIHNVPWKVVPAGVSKKTGKAYDAFQACSVSGCDQRPPR